MSRKVFVSVLGTGLYNKCRYVVDKTGFESSETCFIQQATIELHQIESWNKEDTCLFLLTDSARRNTWDREITARDDRAHRQSVPYQGLQAILDSMSLKCHIVDISIPDGKDESEMWTIFNALYDKILDGDELYFDLTHSFRYLPMLVLVLGNYAQFLKKTSVKAISYGNYEASSDGMAPIVDLLPLASLQDWTFAAGQFLNSGNVSELIQLSNSSLKSILRDENTRDSGRDLNTFIKYLSSVIDERLFCRGIDIVKSSSFSKMKRHADNLDKTVIEPLNPILQKIKNSMNQFDIDTNVRNGFEAAQWCLDNGMYQQATTILFENIETAICIEEGINWCIMSQREVVNIAFNVTHQQFDEDAWYLKLKQDASQEDIEKRKGLIKQIQNNKHFIQMLSPYARLQDLRNDFNHSGMRSTSSSAQKMKVRLTELNKEIRSIFINESGTKPAQESSKKILLNISNHPSSLWSQLQTQSALDQYGQIIDIPFPAINPEADEQDIDLLADEYLGKVLTYSKQFHVTVHLMGEMTFSFALLSLLRSYDIDCIASTTDRIVTKETGEAKTSVFKFTHFRHYK